MRVCRIVCMDLARLVHRVFCLFYFVELLGIRVISFERDNKFLAAFVLTLPTRGREL